MVISGISYSPWTHWFTIHRSTPSVRKPEISWEAFVPQANTKPATQNWYISDTLCPQSQPTYHAIGEKHPVQAFPRERKSWMTHVKCSNLSEDCLRDGLASVSPILKLWQDLTYSKRLKATERWFELAHKHLLQPFFQVQCISSEKPCYLIKS